jgi:EAL domain-containing protein (putative c-di-GMP-specific phosphodiesterase class I)/CheY-like chemotaxis protein
MGPETVMEEVMQARRREAEENRAVVVPGRVLVVDDEPYIVGSFTRLLQAEGYEVESANSGDEGLAKVQSGKFDVVVSDILMPRMDGMMLLRCIREKDLDVPVILLTGAPSMESAMKAVNYGAMRYLTKPVDPVEILTSVQRAMKVRSLARIRRSAVASLGRTESRAGDRAGMETLFDRAMKGVWVAFQPVVRFSRGEVFGFEALVRSTEPALPGPDSLFDAATRLGMLDHLGRAIRRRVAAASRRAPAGTLLLVNVHAHDLFDEDLFDPNAPLSKIANGVVLEITERESLDEVPDVKDRIARLRKLGYRIALDDIGAGYAGLAAFAKLEPDIVKLDMLFTRDVETDATKQQLVKAMTSLCGELYKDVIAEGVETEGERNTLVELGCDLLQGYFFARPARSFEKPEGI